MIARVLPDVAALERVFDYLIPEPLRDQVRVGTIVRIDLHGRRVGGWVVEVTDAPATDRPLKPLAKVTGWGPAPELVELSSWAAWRWAGRRSAFLRAASPQVAVRSLPSATGSARALSTRSGSISAGDSRRISTQNGGTGVTVVRVPPAADVVPHVLDGLGDADGLVLASSVGAAARLARRLRDTGRRVALMPRDWAMAAGGGCTVVGARAAAWAPVPALGAVVVVDEHDEAYQEERAPTWNARDVALERARRADAPAVLLSPCPSLEALEAGELVTLRRADEREGWPVLEIVDRRRDDPTRGLYSERLVQLLRSERRVVCVLNRKGRARLLACAACGELARCEHCGAVVAQLEATLVCRRCEQERPAVCAACGSTRLKVLRPGVTRVQEDLDRLAGRPVVVGTEAALHREEAADAVAFLDFDQELLAPRYRAGEEAMALLARAARLVGGRDRDGRLLVQTRVPRHEVLDAVVHADPGRLAVVESARRAALRLPPEAAVAIVSGEAAEQFVFAVEGVELLGPTDGRWMLRAPDHATLCHALAAVPRPPGRLRVEVDPLRA